MERYELSVIVVSVDFVFLVMSLALCSLCCFPLTDPAIALLGIYPEDTGVLFRRGTCTPMFIAVLSTMAKLWKEPKCPSIDEWIKMMWYIYTMQYYSAMKKNEILPFATMWMELEGILLSKICQSEKDRYHMISFICGI